MMYTFETYILEVMKVRIFNPSTPSYIIVRYMATMWLKKEITWHIIKR